MELEANFLRVCVHTRDARRKVGVVCSNLRECGYRVYVFAGWVYMAKKVDVEGQRDADDVVCMYSGSVRFWFKRDVCRINQRVLNLVYII